MKLRNLFLASAAIAGLFTACSNEMDEAVDNGAQAKEEAYVSFAIQMPSSAATRTLEFGTEEENKVSDITLLFFDTASPHNLTDIQTIQSPKADMNGYNFTTNAFLVSRGSKIVYAFANAQAKIRTFATNDNGAAYTAITAGIGSDSAESMSKDNHFTMSNAESETKADIKYSTQEEALKSPINIAIERTVAKIEYVGNDLILEITPQAGQKSIGKVELQQMKLINANRSYYYLRRVSANADGSNPIIGGYPIHLTPYIVDPNFTQKASEVTTQYRAANFFDTEYINVAEGKFYCLENTMSKEGQCYGATTGITFKAKVKLSNQYDDNTTGTFYRYNGDIYQKSYNDLNMLKEKLNIKDVDVTGWKEKEWKEKGVDLYENGICYYHYMIKHVDNEDPTSMGIMEYGVVRNNVYKLNVTSIKEIGANTPDIDPETPAEKEKAYISVAVNVRPWAIRSNENIEL